MKAKDAKGVAAERRAEYDAWYEEQVRLGLEDLDAGRVVTDEDVRKHFEKRFKQHAGRQQKTSRLSGQSGPVSTLIGSTTTTLKPLLTT